MASISVDVNIHGKGADFSVERAGQTLSTQWLQIGSYIQHASIFLENSDLIRLRDVIDAHLSYAVKDSAAGIVDLTPSPTFGPEISPAGA